MALVIWLLALLQTALSLYLSVFVNWRGVPSDLRPNQGDYAGILTTFSFAAVGALIIWRQPRNRVGWLLAAIPFAAMFIGGPKYYAALALYKGVPLPGPGWVYFVGSVFWLVPFGLFMVVLPLVFPTGRPPSRRWWLALVPLGLLLLISGVAAFDPANTTSVPDPLPLASLRGIGARLNVVFSVLFFSSAGAAIASMVVRYRRGASQEREQLKWLVAAVALMILVFFIEGFVPALQTGVLLPLAATLVPVSIGVAVLRYRLYDIDVIINKALVYGGLAVVITGVYVLLVVNLGAWVGGGTKRLWLSLLATALIAILFQPLRQRAQRLANRLVYGRRATPYEVLSEFSEHLQQTYGGEDVLDRMTRILGEGTGAERAELWVKTGSELVRTSAWPSGSRASLPMADGTLPPLEADKVAPVTHQGEVLGALTIRKKRGESLSSLEEKLLSDLATQAGLVLENAGLNQQLLARLDELRASRQRLVTAQDEERRRIESNLHDGAQQELVALNVKLGLLESMLQRDPERAKSLAAEVRADLHEAIGTLRELAHGIYPPLLASEGLATALQAQVRKSQLPVDLEIRQFPRQPKEIEAAIYFCCLEALQNVAKYAGATRVVIRLSVAGGRLHFEIADDGKGFDLSSVGQSFGLQNMRDRVEALSGELSVRSSIGGGTTISGWVPAADQVAGPAAPSGTVRRPRPVS